MTALIISSADDPHACSLAGTKTQKPGKEAGILIVDVLARDSLRLSPCRSNVGDLDNKKAFSFAPDIGDMKKPISTQLIPLRSPKFADLAPISATPVPNLKSRPFIW